MGHAGLLNFMTVSLTFLLFCLVVLLLLIKFELGSLGGLSSERKLVMSVTLGACIVTFSVKLLVIAVLIKYPEHTMGPRIASLKPILYKQAEGIKAHESSNENVRKTYVWEALPETAPEPTWNPTTPEKVKLGEQLFHDRALSIDHSKSCSSCHDVKKGYGDDHLATSHGVAGKIGKRNAPTVWNVAFQSALFWDGRAATLEEQAKGPMLNPSEMGMQSEQSIVERVSQNEAYRKAFKEAFGENSTISMALITAAIAAYERTLITPDAPYDKFVRGDTHALDAAQLRGMELFQSIGCIQCHSGSNFSAAGILNPSRAAYRIFPVFNVPERLTKYQLTQDTGANSRGSKRGVWRIPSLRNVALTAPYFHNGSVKNLAEAVRIMAVVQRGRILSNEDKNYRKVVWSVKDRTISRRESSTLSDAEVNDIVSFLNSLSSASLSRRSRKL